MNESRTDRILVWRVGRRRCGARIGLLREVLPLPPVIPIPAVPPPVRGVANVRGTVVTVVDCGLLLEEGSGVVEGELILLDLDDRLIGLAVDEVEDVLGRPQVGSDVEVLQLDGLLRPVMEN